MHELSIAMAIVDRAAEECERQGRGRVVAVYLQVGRLSGVAPEAVRSAFALARESVPVVAEASLEIEEISVIAHCPTCAIDRSPVFPHLACSVCGTPMPDVIRGRELEVVAIEIES